MRACYLSFMYRLLFIFCLLVAYSNLNAQPKTDAALQQILHTNKDSLFNLVLQQPDTFRLQIIYTQIDRDKKNKPHFRNYYFNYDPALYFNPASMVKLPLAFLSLEKLNKLNIKGVNKYTTMQFDSSYAGQKPLYKDSTAESGLPSIAHFIRRAFLISENDPYNRMYQFVGQQEINRNLHQKGYADARITRQFMGFTEDGNRHTNAIRFLDSNSNVLYTQPPAYNRDSFNFSQAIRLGNGYLDRNDILVNEPFDFTKHNNLSLQTMQQLLQSVLFPEAVPPKQRFYLTNDDYAFLYRYLSQYPSETPYPNYDTALFYDSYVKFFFRDSTHRMPPGVRVFNKVGWAYGFLTDVSYVADFNNGVEYMLAATLYVNKDGVLNDNKYEFDETGWPFLYRLGQTVYRYELSRVRRFRPDLSRFRIPYEHRNSTDTRPPVKEVDN